MEPGRASAAQRALPVPASTAHQRQSARGAAHRPQPGTATASRTTDTISFLMILTQPHGNCKNRGSWGHRDSRKPRRGEREAPRTFPSQEARPDTAPAAAVPRPRRPSAAGASPHPDPSLRSHAPALSHLPAPASPLTPLTRHAGSDVTKTMCFSNLVVQLVLRALALSVFIPCNIHHTGLFMGPLFGKVFFRPGE